MVVFLDFDGVCHPWNPREFGFKTFCFLPRIEGVLREFPMAQVVIASDWRRMTPLPALKRVFSEDMRARVVGANPVHDVPEDMPGYRQREALDWLEVNDRVGAPWVALDDLPGNWEAGEPRLIVCEDGFFAREEGLLREALAAMDRRSACAKE